MPVGPADRSVALAAEIEIQVAEQLRLCIVMTCMRAKGSLVESSRSPCGNTASSREGSNTTAQASVNSLELLLWRPAKHHAHSLARADEDSDRLSVTG